MDKRYYIYLAIVIVCIIAIGIGVYAQIFYPNSENDALMIGKDNSAIIQANEAEEQAKNKFNTMFTNTLEYTTQNIANKAVRRYSNKDLVYTSNQYIKEERDKYELNVNIPYLNIVSDNADKINMQIEQLYVSKLSQIVSAQQLEYTIYNIDYIAYVNYNVISLVIKATLKEGNNPQRVIITTYNYNTDNGNLVTLDEFLNFKQINKSSLQNKINKEIEEKSKNSEDLSNIGYTVYKRNPDDNMYKLENTTTYFLANNGYIYIIYPYGNNNNTSEYALIVC